MILLDYVVQILDLPDLDRRFPFSVDGLQGRQIGPAFVHGHGLRRAVAIDGLLEVAARGNLVAMRPQQEIDRIAGLVHCAIQVFPLAAHLDVGFIHPPALTHRTFALAKGFLEQRYELDDPAMHARMINLKAALSHHLLEIAKA
ncbi:hypothetical protein R69927_07843 [Paraburkholderia domus]|nr:hypothetical protein R69927_07843 [Paraburkholderia domus]